MLRRHGMLAAIAAAVFLFVLANGGARLATDWMWFSSLGFSQVFTTILLSKVVIRVLVGVVFFIFILVNLLPTRRAFLDVEPIVVENENVVAFRQGLPWRQFLNERLLTWACFGVSLVLAYMFSLAVSGDWATWQQFLHASSFGSADPVFGKDIGFYFFKLPFYSFLYVIAFWGVLLVTVLVGLSYFLASPFQGIAGFMHRSRAPVHMSILVALLLAVKAAGYILQQYGLLFSPQGVVYGPGFTDLHANLLAIRVLFVLALAGALVMLANIWLRRAQLLLYTIGGLIAASFVLGVVVPAAVQKFYVEPNELNREKPYIEHSIAMTRKAYNLDEVEQKSFPAGRVLTRDDILANQGTIRNVRLWDWQPMKSTYSQLQEMRFYYEFKDIDIDRYTIDGEYRQVMLAARELNQEQLPPQARTWVSERLQYTHGYGVAASPVNEVTGEGLPQFFLKDIPPQGIEDLRVTEPRIYYGESTDNYVIVNTKAKEFDYPEGDTNVHTTYAGKSGVTLGSLPKCLLFALSLGDYKLLLAPDVTAGSQVLYYRNIHERVPKIAPFLDFDEDPYLVIHDGRLYWIWDAYTTSDMFPYSEPYQGRHNYIRNSVKVVVDAYNGQVAFYLADPNDPVARTWGKIFPGLLKPLDQMPEGLRAHLRYPEDLFRIQAHMYATYHMENPQVFYTKEDRWHMATEIFGSEGKEQVLEPYYTIIALPGEQKPEYVMISAFTPQNKKNLVAWMAARSDGENYGKLLVYEMPKQSLVYGPAQVETRINQDTTISQQLTLWDQKGSQVIRGNLMVIPIKDGLLYIEPVYLQAEQSKMPELRRVIVVHGDRVVMEPTLAQALDAIFGKGEERGTPATGDETPSPAGSADRDKTVSQLIAEANRLFDQAQESLKNGDWAAYGAKQEQLKAVLQELATRESV
ncbi:MAG: UPF0182 family protein [Thermoanaerobacterales bacterium]|nr:UPF0182 family protein [Thermoanaerobacterales bacterium]